MKRFLTTSELQKIYTAGVGKKRDELINENG